MVDSSFCITITLFIPVSLKGEGEGLGKRGFASL